MRKGNISIFVPHNGCPCECSFCNQKTITGHSFQPTPFDVKAAVETALKKDNLSYEIAFFGGSFTAIERSYMVSLLETAYDYVKEKKVDGIRISTRPDFIDDEILSLLKSFGVTSIELGAQSMDEDVLTLNKRGHNSSAVINASKLIKAYGFELGLQMMTGLYGDTNEKAINTAKHFIELKPQTVRIYPTVVLKGTYLAQLYESGIYKPQTVDEAVNLCAVLVPMFNNAGIKVIRLGLHSSQDIKENMLAGGFHDCFGELVASKIMLDRIMQNEKGSYVITINPKSISKLYGNKKKNLTILSENGYIIKIKSDSTLGADDVRIENGT